MDNKFVFNIVDERFYPEARLQADNALFGRFVTEELEPIPWDGNWALFRLKLSDRSGREGPVTPP